MNFIRAGWHTLSCQMVRPLKRNLIRKMGVLNSE
ncbi:hypothetical protein [Klebsiella phage vB_KpnS-VAC113]|uniref:Uncharacterized protein n=1 Tax=Klebsiella phage vB_KpnS-VAC113 TaxID=2866702 RepID=A0AAE8YEE2_9CAUD|nr:hypothetical protein [Klebsiella phage vB_KpnS-VAC113]